MVFWEGRGGEPGVIVDSQEHEEAGEGAGVAGE